MSVRSPELSEEQQRLQDGAIEFARTELGNEIVRRDREEEFSREDWIGPLDAGPTPPAPIADDWHGEPHRFGQDQGRTLVS